ncbi:hypothetical protein D3C72_1414160 [compost metagenome]
MAPGQFAYLALRVGHLAQVDRQVVQCPLDVAHAMAQRCTQAARLGVVRVLGQHTGGLVGGHGVTGCGIELQQMRVVQGHAAQADAHQGLHRNAGGLGPGDVVRHQRCDVICAQVGIADHQVMPVACRGGHVAHAQRGQAGVEMRGPFARQQAAALRGLMQPRARLGIAAQAHQHGAVAVRDHPARGPAVRRLQRQRVKPRQRLVQHRQRGVGVTVVKVQPRPQRDEINHLGAGLRQLVGNLQGFDEAPLVG